MKPTLNDLRDSALFAGVKSEIKNGKVIGWTALVRGWFEWNPPEKAEQDRELRDAIYAKALTIHSNSLGGVVSTSTGRDLFDFDCHPNDFLTLAAAHLWRQKNG